MRLQRTAAVLALAAALAGCSTEPGSGTAPQPGPSIPLEERCAEAAAIVVEAAQRVVQEYSAPSSPAPSASAPVTTESPQPSAPVADDELQAAVAEAASERDRLGCDPARFRADIEAGLAAVEAEGPVADAVRRRVSASILGTGRTEAGEWALESDVDLRDAVAQAAAGTTILLSAATWTLDGTLVLLDGVVLRGAGRDATVLRSTASDAAVLIVTAGLVRLESLTLEMAAEAPVSGVVGGPAASVALSDVRITGARAGEGDVGGAGLLLSASGDEGSSRGTTLEVTDSLLDGNEWAGIALSGGHRASIESTTFAGNGEAGAVFLGSTSGSVRGSTFVDNGIGLAATGSATPAWLESTVEGGVVGLQIIDSAAPVIDGMRISGATSAAVIVGGAAGGHLERLTCSAVPHGVVIADGAAPTLGALDCPVVRGDVP